jgi:trehalose 6-phosphate phosphatase
MRHLFDCWDDITGRLKATRTVALFLDFDGTLAWIAERPSRASLPASTRRALERLSRRRAVRVSIVSGRDYLTLRKAVGVPGIHCLGLYGWENGNGLRLALPARRVLAAAKRDLETRLGELSGIWIEEKGDAFAVHYREAARASVRRARTALRAALQPFSEVLRVVRGKKAWEVLPVSNLGKGAAVLRELSQHPAGLAIYAGDDVADECAFNAIPTGISIHVGARSRSHAQYRLRDPEEVRLFLEKLEEELP